MKNPLVDEKKVKTSFELELSILQQHETNKTVTIKDLTLQYFPFLSPSWNAWNIPEQKVNRAFNIIKVLYIFFLVPFHITCAANVVSNNPVYASYYLPYQTTGHGLEYMAGLLLISGWLSHTTTKPGTKFLDQMKKKLLRLLPSYYFGAMPLTLLCIIYEGCTGKLYTAGGPGGVAAQFVLDLLTMGSWNPALLFWTRNRPLWFMSNLLTYHYCSAGFLNWIRNTSPYYVSGFIIGCLILRLVTAVIILVCLVRIFPTTYSSYSRILHLCSLDQIYLPFIGAALAEFAKRVGSLTWSPSNIWRATDFVTVVTIALSLIVLSPPLYTDDFSNSLSG